MRPTRTTIAAGNANRQNGDDDLGGAPGPDADLDAFDRWSRVRSAGGEARRASGLMPSSSGAGSFSAGSAFGAAVVAACAASASATASTAAAAEESPAPAASDRSASSGT